jgi:hypothetical protein
MLNVKKKQNYYKSLEEDFENLVKRVTNFFIVKFEKNLKRTTPNMSKVNIGEYTNTTKFLREIITVINRGLNIRNQSISNTLEEQQLRYLEEFSVNKMEFIKTIIDGDDWN